MKSPKPTTIVTEHKKTRPIGNFWENEVLTELANFMKTAEKNQKTELHISSQTDLILLSFDKFDLSKK